MSWPCSLRGSRRPDGCNISGVQGGPGLKPLKNKRFYLFIFRERGREGERAREKHRYAKDTSIGCLWHAPNWGPGLQPGHVP